MDNTDDDSSIGTMSASDYEIRARAQTLLSVSSIASREEQFQQREGMPEAPQVSSSSPCTSTSSIPQTTDVHPLNSTDSQLEILKHEHEATKLKCKEMEKLNIELMDKIGMLSDENLLLTQKQEESCSETITQLETIEEETESLIIIEELEEENEVLRQLKEENEQLVGHLNQQIARFLEAHEDTIAEYEEELAGLVEELAEAILSNEKLSVELRELKEEHEVLIAAMVDEDINCDNYYEKMLIELKAEKAEAHRVCEMLQEKISHLLGVSKYNINGESVKGQLNEDELSELTSESGEVADGRQNESSITELSKSSNRTLIDESFTLLSDAFELEKLARYEDSAAKFSEGVYLLKRHFLHESTSDNCFDRRTKELLLEKIVHYELHAEELLKKTKATEHKEEEKENESI